MVNPRRGSYTPSPAQQTIVTGVGGVVHSPHSSHHGTFSPGASPSTASPTGSNSLTKIVVAQVYLLLSTIKEDKDRTKWDQQAEQIRKLIDDHGMEVFSKYFTRLVIGNAAQIFPGINRHVANPANYQILVGEVRKITQDVAQARKIAESIDTAHEDLFRDFDLSTFMEHFKLDALQKTTLALAFKMSTRSDLRTKADAILSANFNPFLEILSQPQLVHENLTTDFLATLIDEFIQEHPPNFDGKAQAELYRAVHFRYVRLSEPDIVRPVPTALLAALFLTRLLHDQQKLVLAMHKAGSDFTHDEERCRLHLQESKGALDEQQVAAALLYSAISKTLSFSTSVLVASLRSAVRGSFDWQQVITEFDQPDLCITENQLMVLYNALLPLAQKAQLDIQALWTGLWHHRETQLSFLGAYALLKADDFDALAVPGVRTAFTVEEYASSSPEVQERASAAVHHPLNSVAAVSAVLQVAFSSTTATTTVEANRLFSDVIVPNLDVFVIAAFSARDAWTDAAAETIGNIINRFICKLSPGYDFVLETLWRRDKIWLVSRLVELHAKSPLELGKILEHAVQHSWLSELTLMLTGFGLDLAALAHAQDLLDLGHWVRNHASRNQELAAALLPFLNIKASHELGYQRGADNTALTVTLPVKTISMLLSILEGILPKVSLPDLIVVQRACITAYPRLINYGQGYDDIIDANGKQGNSLPKEANDKMEEHYKSMYSQDLEVLGVVNALESYKHSRQPYDQDIFACMIHGLFDEYSLYGTYPLEALATTAVLFGGIISRKLISGLPLDIGLGMILEALREHMPEQSMHKFGLQALMQLFPRLHEWPSFCAQLVEIPALRGSEAYKHAEEVVHSVKPEEQNPASTKPRVNGDSHGGAEDGLENAAMPFTSIYAEPSPLSNIYEDPSIDARDKIQFILNNITEQNVVSRFQELKDIVELRHHEWFASHLVEERAKLQPNYHSLYLELVNLFNQKSLWAEILRETYISVIRMLNADSTLRSSTERTHLKTLGGWLGSLTLARDKPIKQRNIAFRELLLEAFDSQRLVVVIPFVCKVLAAGAQSTVFKSENPWIMSIVYLLIELYHHADLKLNQKFEIEVLCKSLHLDHNAVEPSNIIMTRVPPAPEDAEVVAPEMLDRFENLSMSGMGGGVASGRFSPAEITSSIPDLGPLLSYPPVNDMVNQQRLHDIVRNAITRAVHEIIAPVVERSVTIAAISTAQMIRKDFATEPDASRMRSAAINMVKKTAGSLALVTSKEPLRASMTNYIRQYSSELPQMLPEGTIIMCVNSNLDLACSQVEKKAEERAVPEIEDMLEPEFEARRRHRAMRPEDVYMDNSILTRWALTIPAPYKLQPTHGGLNDQQMAIYDEFARIMPRTTSAAGNHHVATTSDATRSMANDILQDQFPIPNLPTPAETPAMPLMNSKAASYGQANAALSNGGRLPTMNLAASTPPERVQKLLAELQRAASTAAEQHYADLPRPHPILDVLDAIFSLLIRSQQYSDAFDVWIAEQICAIVFGGEASDLVVESLIHMLQNICRIGGRTAKSVYLNIGQQPPNVFQNVALVTTLIATELLDWQRVDFATYKALAARKAGSLDFFVDLLDKVLFNDSPVALFTDFARSLEVAFEWSSEDSELPVGQALKGKLQHFGLPQPLSQDDQDRLQARQVQMDYVFMEWLHLYNNPNASGKSIEHFIAQMYNKQIINDRNDLCLFLRTAIDSSVERFERHSQNAMMSIDAYLAIDSLAKLVTHMVKGYESEGEVKIDKVAYFKSILALTVLLVNHHHVVRGEHFCQKVFFRLYSTLLSEVSYLFDGASDHPQLLIEFAGCLLSLRPSIFPGILFGWLGLITHRDLIHPLMMLPNQQGWEPIIKLLETLLQYVGDLLKPLHISLIAKEVYRSATKLLVVLHHDYPDFVAASCSRLSAATSSHCVQLRNLILNASPAQMNKMPDPMQPGLKVDTLAEMGTVYHSEDLKEMLAAEGLLGLIDQALQAGPSEDAIAHITHTVQRSKDRQSTIGYVPISVNVPLISSVVSHIGKSTIEKGGRRSNTVYHEDSTDARLISMLIHELSPEARYYFINGMVDQLRFPNAYTHYFSQVILGTFGTGQHDQEEYDIQQQICRILLERLLGQWPQPWGLIITVLELIKNEKYMFFDLPFIKSAPEVADSFARLVQRPL